MGLITHCRAAWDPAERLNLQIWRTFMRWLVCSNTLEWAVGAVGFSPMFGVMVSHFYLAKTASATGRELFVGAVASAAAVEGLPQRLVD